MTTEYYAACLIGVRIGGKMLPNDFDGAQRLNAFLEDRYAAVVLPQDVKASNRFEVRAATSELLGEYVRKVRDEQDRFANK